VGEEMGSALNTRKFTLMLEELRVDDLGAIQAAR
jgi:hypothetical protein